MIRYSAGATLLLIASAVYIFFRPEALLHGAVDLSHLAPAFLELPDVLKGSLPDALWYASLLCFQKPLTFRQRRIGPPLTLLACATGPVHELLQAVRAVPGTFCPFDLAAYFIILFLYSVLCLRKSET